MHLVSLSSQRQGCVGYVITVQCVQSQVGVGNEIGVGVRLVGYHTLSAYLSQKLSLLSSYNKQEIRLMRSSPHQ